MRTKHPHLLNFIFLLSIASFNLQATNAVADEDSKTAKNGFSWTLTSGLTYDSNVFRAPDDSTYLDYADSCVAGDINCDTTVGYTNVTSTVQDATYIELDIEPSYRKKLSENHTLDSQVKFSGNFYTDSKVKDANTFKYSLDFGDEVTLRKKNNKHDSLYIGWLTGHIDKRYLDRDTGESKFFSGSDISERYTYNFYGAEIKVKLRTTKYKYNLVYKQKQSHYVDVDINNVKEMVYDNKYTLLGGKVKIPLPGKIKLSLGYDFYSYRYNHPDNPRKSRRAATGQLAPLTDLAARKYDYGRSKLTLRKRLSKKWLAYMDLERTIRNDLAEKYDDYKKNKIKIRIIHEMNPQFKFKYALSVWKRTYPIAVAFDNVFPPAPATPVAKEYDGQDFRFTASKLVTKKRSYILDFRYRNDDSTDLRYDYDRIKLGLSVEWQS